MSFLETVNDELKKRHPGGLVVAVAVDGSQMSDRATVVAARFCNPKRDKLFIMHVSDKSKTYLPPHLKPSYLKSDYEVRVAKNRLGLQGIWMCREKEEGQSTCQTLTKMADNNGVDLLILGSFGRKGEKLDVLGSVSDHSLRHSHASICIVRSTGRKVDGPAKFLFATDGSHAAALAFAVLCNMLVRETDVVEVIMVSTTDGVAEGRVVEQYRDFITKRGINGIAGVRCIDITSTTVPQGIIDAARDAEADVLVMGISGYGKKKLGSVSEEISMHAHCTTLIIKDSYDVLSNRFSSGLASLTKSF